MFNRTESNGWGNADVGGAWTPSNPAGLSVASGAGLMTLNPKGANRTVQLAATSSADTDLTLNFSMDKNAAGGTTFVYVDGRRVNDTTTYRALLRYNTNGTVSISLEGLRGSPTATTLASAVIHREHHGRNRASPADAGLRHQPHHRPGQALVGFGERTDRVDGLGD